LTTLATLLLELSLTRIFSVIFHHHFVFLAISIALFGLGLGGVFSYVVAGWKGPLFIKLGRLSAVNSICVVGAMAVNLAQGTNLQVWNYALVYFTTAVPFFLAGAIVSLAISETIERVNRVYFFDLLGAAAGCLLLLPLLEWFGGPSTVIGAAIFFAVAAAIWHSMAGTVLGRAGSVALSLALVAFLIINVRYHVLDIRYAKDRKIENETFVKWNSFSRIGLTQQKGQQDLIVIDADASTGVFPFDLDNLTAKQRHDVKEQGQALPYAVRPPFVRTELDHRVFVIFPRELSCCPTQWFAETRQAIERWSSGAARDTAVVLRWQPVSGDLRRAESGDMPQLPALVRALLEMHGPDELDANLRRMLDELAH